MFAFQTIGLFPTHLTLGVAIRSIIFISFGPNSENT